MPSAQYFQIRSLRASHGGLLLWISAPSMNLPGSLESLIIRLSNFSHMTNIVYIQFLEGFGKFGQVAGIHRSVSAANRRGTSDAGCSLLTGSRAGRLRCHSKTISTRYVGRTTRHHRWYIVILQNQTVYSKAVQLLQDWSHFRRVGYWPGPHMTRVLVESVSACIMQPINVYKVYNGFSPHCIGSGDFAVFGDIFKWLGAANFKLVPGTRVGQLWRTGYM